MAIRRSDGREGNELTQMTIDPVTFCQRKWKGSSTKSHLELAGTYLISCRKQGKGADKHQMRCSEDFRRSFLMNSVVKCLVFLAFFLPDLFDMAVAFMPRAV